MITSFHFDFFFNSFFLGFHALIFEILMKTANYRINFIRSRCVKKGKRGGKQNKKYIYNQRFACVVAYILAIETIQQRWTFEKKQLLANINACSCNNFDLCTFFARKVFYRMPKTMNPIDCENSVLSLFKWLFLFERLFIFQTALSSITIHVRFKAMQM